MAEFTQIDYDTILRIFLSDDDLKPAMQVANRVGDFVYSTDAHSLIKIPGKHVIHSDYEPHPKTPNYEVVIGNLKPIEPVLYKDVELFNTLEKCPKEMMTVECNTCNGTGECTYCGGLCGVCDGHGEVDDPNKRMVHSTKLAGIMIGDQCFAPFELAKLEQLLLITGSQRFEVISKSNVCIMIKVLDMEVLIARLDISNDKHERKIFNLTPIS